MVLPGGRAVAPWALLAVSMLLSLSGARADAICPALPGGATLASATLTIKPSDRTGHTVTARIDGVATLPDTLSLAQREGISPRALCRAALGSLELVDRQPVCDAFEETDFTASDSIAARDGKARFRIARDIRGDNLPWSILLRDNAGPRACAQNTTLRVVAGAGMTIDRVHGLSDGFSRNEAVLAPHALAARDYMQFDVGMTMAEPGRERFYKPLSLLERDSWATRVLSRLALVLLQAALLLVLLRAAMPRLLATTPPGESFHRPMRSALTLLVTGAVLAASEWMGYSFYRFSSATESALRNLVREWLGGAQARFADADRVVEMARPVLPLACILVLSLALFAVAALLRRRRATPARAALRDWSGILFASTALAMLVAVLAAGLRVFELYGAPGFEIPALAISLIVAALSVGAFRKRLTLKAGVAAAMAVALAITALFPTSAVTSSTGEAPTAADNAQSWYVFLSGVAAQSVFAGALLSGALLLVARQDGTRTERHGIDRALVLLLIVSVPGLNIDSVTDMLALACVWLVADRALFSRAQATPPSADGVARLDRLARRLRPAELRVKALVGGGATAAVSLLQFAAQKKTGAAVDHAVLWSIAPLLSAFATGAIGTLILGHAFNALRGSSAAAKAALIVIVVIAANIAANFHDIAGHGTILQAIGDYVGFAAAILAVAVFEFDLPTARAQLGPVPLSELFKRTTLAQAVPIATGLGGAALSALAPLLFPAMGEPFRNMLDALSKALAPH